MEGGRGEDRSALLPLAFERLRPADGLAAHVCQGRNTRLLAPFDTKTDRFTNTGSGQTQGKLKKETRFLCEARLARLGTYITVLFHSRPAYL